MTGLERSGTTTVVLVIVAWLVAATALGATGVLRALRPPAPQLVLLTLTALVVLLGLTHPGLRAWVMTVDERLLVSLHLTRFVGVYFLVLYDRGELPFDFAVPGGWGDIVVATLAVGLIVRWRAASVGGWWAYSIWNVVGLVDILFVVATAARLAFTAPESVAALLRLPLNLLLTWLVPLIIASHVLLGVRLARHRPTGTRHGIVARGPEG
jgi:hypothetical protein